MALYVLVLAAGKGTRMKSALPKPLHLIAGQPMVSYVLEALASLKVDDIYVVVGHQSNLMKKIISHKKIKFIEQKEQLGTGHAVMQAKKFLSKTKGDILVLSGDTPLITLETLKALLETHRESNAAATVLTQMMPDPTGYGRIIRSAKGSILKIVEQKDASPEEVLIKEVNTGTYCFNIHLLFEALKEIKTDNVQKEYYLTDVIGILKKKKCPVYACQGTDYKEVQGVNTREDLAELTKIIYQRVNQKLMQEGVTLIDPATTYIDTTCQIKQDTIIYPGTFIRGQTKVGRNCSLGPNSEISESVVGDNVKIKNSQITQSIIEDGVQISYAAVNHSKIKSGQTIPPSRHLSRQR